MVRKEGPLNGDFNGFLDPDYLHSIKGGQSRQVDYAIGMKVGAMEYGAMSAAYQVPRGNQTSDWPPVARDNHVVPQLEGVKSSLGG